MLSEGYGLTNLVPRPSKSSSELATGEMRAGAADPRLTPKRTKPLVPPEGLYRRGLEVTVVEKAPQIVPQQFDATASEMLKRDMEAEGIRLILGAGVLNALIRTKTDIARLKNQLV